MRTPDSAVDLEEQTRRRAYELYERRGREAGHETEDWLQSGSGASERELYRSSRDGHKQS